MEKPVADIAMAIESKDVAFLSGLKGIGKRTAQKIIASLHGKTGDFIIAGKYNKNKNAPGSNKNITASLSEVIDQVKDVLVGQLGYSTGIAEKMIAGALDRNHTITTPEELFDEVYHRINDK